MALDDIRACPALGEAADITEDDTAEPHDALYRLAHTIGHRRAVRRLDSALLSEDASPADEPYEEEHDRDHQ